MAASDALIVGEDWISEHYFTTDAKSESFQAKVAERRKAWDEDAKTVREDGDPESKVDTVRSRFLAARGSLSADLASLLADAPDVADAKLPDLYARLRTVLGYNTGEYTLKQVGPVIRVTTPDLNEAAPLVIVEARAADDRRGSHRQGRQDAADPVRGRRNDDVSRRWRGCCRHCSSRTTGPSSPWCWRAGGCSSPSGRAGPRGVTWPSTCSSSATGTTPRAAARSTAP